MFSEWVEPPADPDPLLETWAAGRRIVRCHHSRFGATEFNPGHGQGRFHPLCSAAGVAIPTLYGSGSIDGALSETIFHRVPLRGALRAVSAALLVPLIVSRLAPRRDLRLIQLHGYGLGRLGTSRAQLIESDVDRYERTRRWAQALHALPAAADGLIWVARQHDASFALVLFGDRVERDDLEVIEPPLPLAMGAGFARVQEAAEAAGILIVS